MLKVKVGLLSKVTPRFLTEEQTFELREPRVLLVDGAVPKNITSVSFSYKFKRFVCPNGHVGAEVSYGRW